MRGLTYKSLPPPTRASHLLTSKVAGERPPRERGVEDVLSIPYLHPVSHHLPKLRTTPPNP